MAFDPMILPMTPDHLPEVMAIDAQCYPIPWSREVYESELARTYDRLYVIARLDRVVGDLDAKGIGPSRVVGDLDAKGIGPSRVVGDLDAKGFGPSRVVGDLDAKGIGPSRVVGHAGVAFEENEAHITSVTVAPDCRGQGIGARLFLALALAARRRNTSLALEVAADNPSAQSLYRRFGLAPVGIQRGYYANMGLSPDAVVMRADNIHQPDYADRLVKIAVELDCA